MFSELSLSGFAMSCVEDDYRSLLNHTNGRDRGFRLASLRGCDACSADCNRCSHDESSV